jgi:hypothetical protein
VLLEQHVGIATGRSQILLKLPTSLFGSTNEVVMYQRSRSNSKGVSFGGPDPNAMTTTKRHHGIDEEPPTKKKKLFEPSPKSSSSRNGIPFNPSPHTVHYQYQAAASIALGSTPSKTSESDSQDTFSLDTGFRAQSAPAVEAQLFNGQELIELTAESVIHFKKPTMREAAALARPYAPQSASDTSSLASIHASQASFKPPWVKKDYAPGLIGLDEEIRDFYRYLQPTREERMLRHDLVERLKRTIRMRFSQADVRFFGSLATDLLLPSSDIDIVVLGVSPIQSNLWIVRSLLTKNGFSSSPIVIAHAKVPLVKFTDELSGIDVDISFDQPNGLRNTQVINSFASKFVSFRPLLLTIKFLLQQLAINEPYNGGLGSYGLSMMLASFIQMHPKTNHVTGGTEPNLAYLLLDFFALYGRQFNYYTIGISVRGNGSYFNKFERGWIDPHQPFLASIEDPNDVST